MSRDVVVHEPSLPPAMVQAGATPAMPPVTRRGVLKLAFWGAMFASVGGIGASVVNTLYPRKVEPFGGPVAVLATDVPKVGDLPKANFDGHFLLVNLASDEGRIAGDPHATEGGLLALWWKCPHLGCTVPWKESFVASADTLGRRGWFNCNCHGSTYTKAGVRIAGPAPRSMDTMELSVDKGGNLIVNTGKRRSGDVDNPRRALPWPGTRA